MFVLPGVTLGHIYIDFRECMQNRTNKIHTYIYIKIVYDISYIRNSNFNWFGMNRFNIFIFAGV